MEDYRDIVSSDLLIRECFDGSGAEWTEDVRRGIRELRTGYISPDGAPGMGVTLREKEAAKHPYSGRRFLRLFDEGWEHRSSK